MTEKVTVRVANGGFRYDREQYEEGDELEVHEAALERHPWTLERVDEEEDVDGDDVIDETDTIEFDVGDHTISELEEALATGEYDDVLDELEAAELDGEDRQGALDAIDERRSKAQEE